MLLVRYRRLICIMIHAELVLVVSAIERHLNLLRIFGVRVRIVHRSEARGFATRTRDFVLGEADLVFLVFGLGLCAQIVGEVSGVVSGEISGIRVGDGDIVKETGAAKDEFFFPGSCFAEQLFRVVGKNCNDELIEGLSF